MSGLTVICGAGAEIELGGPSTSAITAQLLTGHQNDEIQVYSEAEKYRLCSVLEFFQAKINYFLNGGPDGPDQANFEDIFQLLEELGSYIVDVQSTQTGSFRSFYPVTFPFLQVDQSTFRETFGSVLDPSLIKKLRTYCYFAIGEIIQNSLRTINLENEENQWFSRFFRSIQEKQDIEKSDIFTLNYGDLIEQSFEDEEFETGFVRDEDGLNYKNFDYETLRETEQTRIAHLHGSIFYGYPIKNHGEFKFGRFPELVLFDSTEEAIKTWAATQSKKTSSGHDISVGPFITGLAKREKILIEPFYSYEAISHESIVENNALLVIGVSGWDKHLTKMIQKHREIHGTEGSIIFITWEEDVDQLEIDKNSHLQESFSFANSLLISLIDRNLAPSMSSQANYEWLPNKDGLNFPDDNVVIYLKGFKHAVNNYQEEILERLVA